MTQGFATEAVTREVPSRFGVFALAFLGRPCRPFVLTVLAITSLVASALLARSKHRQVHRHIFLSGNFGLCPTVVEEHRPDLRVVLQDVRVPVAVILY